MELKLINSLKESQSLPISTSPDIGTTLPGMRFIMIFLLSLPIYAQDTYGPMPSLEELAPHTPVPEQGNLNLQYENWYQRLGKDISQKDDIEWNLRPNSEITDRLKEGATNGGLNINRELKNIKPNQLEGELIIRY